MKCSALNVDFNGLRFDPLASRSPPYERIKFAYPLQNVRFLLLSTKQAREWLQIDTDLLRTNPNIFQKIMEENDSGCFFSEHSAYTADLQVCGA